MRKVILLLYLVIYSHTHGQSITDETDSLTKKLTELTKEGFINGFSVALVNKDTVLYTKGFGYSNIDKQNPYTENTIQNIGSISKTLIGIALLKAQEQGKLKLDDPINKYLPFEVINPNHPNIPITIRHLATHTSSIKDTKHYDEKAYVLEEDTFNSKSLKKISEKFNSHEDNFKMNNFLLNLLHKDGVWYKKNNFLKEKPGALFHYSNIGATLAAYIIEIATEESYDLYTDKHILKPLGMHASGWSFNTVDSSNYSTLYADPNTPLPKYSLVTYPDGGLITSANDLSKYLSELIKGYTGGGTLLTNESYKELFTQQLHEINFEDRNENNPYDDEYNSGIFMGFSAKDYIGHTGSDPGITCFMFFNSKTYEGRILLINTALINQGGVEQFKAIWNLLGEYAE